MNQVNWVTCVITTFAVALGLVGCGWRQSDAEDALRLVFDDFSYVARQPLAEDFRPGFQPSDTKGAPAELEPGYRYVFHRRLPTNNVQLATEVLPERLKRHGFEVLEFPKTHSDMKYSFVGGPLFKITFRRGERSALIFNAVDTVIVQDEAYGRLWAPDDYVLELWSRQTARTRSQTSQIGAKGAECLQGWSYFTRVSVSRRSDALTGLVCPSTAMLGLW